ncbi:MAG: PaaI family thioesterase [Sinobacterium sp.]|nr:PaaI family thioesterase [Sinobacterium sp.]
MTDSNDAAKQIQAHVMEVIDNLKHCKSLGITSVSAGRGQITLALPYSEALIGNPETKVIHGGALTTLMDTACGFAAVLGLDEPMIAPTLDLRIDYMRSATPGKTVLGEAVAIRVTSSVVFARGTAYHEDAPDDPIAHCTASFMRITPEAKQAEEKRKATTKHD